jgi:hypothetical protein
MVAARHASEVDAGKAILLEFLLAKINDAIVLDRDRATAHSAPLEVDLAMVVDPNLSAIVVSVRRTRVNSG